MILGLMMIGFGLTFNSLPFFIQTAFERLSSLTTPMILLYIGIVVKIGGKKTKENYIFTILAYRFIFLFKWHNYLVVSD